MNKRLIKQKIHSVKSTAKITKAMEMVATGKIKRCRERQAATKAYDEGVSAILGHLASNKKAFPQKIRRYLDAESARDEKVLYLLIGSDRGLCGGLNIQMFRATLEHIKSNKTLQTKAFLTFGRKAERFAKSTGAEVLGVAHTYEVPDVAAVIGHVQIMMDTFKEGQFDRVYVSYNRYVNAISQVPTVVQILPVKELERQGNTGVDYDYNPAPEAIFEPLLKRYLESSLLHALYENIASEKASRMMAMRSATDNAHELVRSLETHYHKQRQGAITQEISEIIGGAGALES